MFSDQKYEIICYYGDKKYINVSFYLGNFTWINFFFRWVKPTALLILIILRLNVFSIENQNRFSWIINFRISQEIS